MQLGFYFNQSRCTGCFACLIACKDWHGTTLKETPNWIQVGLNESGKYPSPAMSYIFTTCFHCAKPLCESACPVGAIIKRDEDGIVGVDRDLCLGKENCEGFCRQACPYQIPQFGPETDSKIQKCNFCLERWKEQKKPICVEACIMRALDAGPLDNLKDKYGKIYQVDGFSYSKKLMPSILFTPKNRTDGFNEN
jgi:anaerobic dimethyl sulfoxide reductase subunit B (iron-sulfur subunit)